MASTAGLTSATGKAYKSIGVCCEYSAVQSSLWPRCGDPDRV